jgi:hypothetical protein
MRSAWSTFSCEEHDGCYVAAFAFLHEAWAVAAEFARVVLGDGVGAVISDNIVNADG